MRCTSQQLLGSLLCVVAVSCGGDEPPEEHGRPATFGDSCMLGGLDPCHEPFVCLAQPDFSLQQTAGPICSMACQQNSDCPSWQGAAGAGAPCGGTVQSQCVRLVCRDVCR